MRKLTDKEYIKHGNIKVSKYLGIFVQDTCVANCKSCCIQNRSTTKGKIPLDLVSKAINEAKNLNFSQICISGGELTVQPEYLLDLAKICNESKLPFTLATNGQFGYWHDHGKGLFQELKEMGLTLLLLSTDEFHNISIPYEIFLKALATIKSLDIPYEIHWTKQNDGLDPIEVIPYEYYSKTKLSIGRIANAGNAKKLPSSYFQPALNHPDFRWVCDGVVSFVLTPMGNIFPCCSVMGFSELLTIGNIHSQTLQDTIYGLELNDMLFYLKTFGFKKLVKDLNLNKYVELDRVTSCCDYCELIYSDMRMYSHAKLWIDEALMKYANSLVDNIIA